MNKIIITAPTKMEVITLQKYIQKNKLNNINIIITGIGIVNTIFSLYDNITVLKDALIINTGIAGSFNNNISLGTVVNVISERFGDIGYEENKSFKTLFDINLENPNDFPYNNEIIENYLSNEEQLFNNLIKVKGLTVNSITNSNDLLKIRKNRFNCDIETMEGAAFFYFCKKHKLNYLQIRAISNITGPKHKNKWDIELAINNLNNYLIENLITKFDKIQVAE